MKSNNLLQNEELDIEICKCLKDKITVQNVMAYYCIADTLKLFYLSKTAFSYIQRCFTMVTDTKLFLKLDFRLVAKILSSSQLVITSELEIFKAGQIWINYGSEERSCYAKDILLKVRFPLLSKNELDYMKKLPFNKTKDSSTLIDHILKQKEHYFKTKLPAYFAHRYCTQNNFNVLLCYGCDWKPQEFPDDMTEAEIEDTTAIDILDTDITQINVENLNDTKVIGSMAKNERFYNSSVFCKGELYFFFCCDDKGECFSTVEKYSLLKNTSEVVSNVRIDRYNHCVCNFMDEIYIIGGNEDVRTASGLCDKFDPKQQKCVKVASLNFSRMYPACSVLNGKIVVTGGNDWNNDTKTVEAYDHTTDRWSYMPSMISARANHGSAVVRNKLFVVGGYGGKCEVFDLLCNRFAAVKNKNGFYLRGDEMANKTFSVGNELLVFFEGRKTALRYNPDKREWSEASCEFTEKFAMFTCVKVPSY